jgi:hypothetical protein
LRRTCADASKLAKQRGHVSEADVLAVKGAGHADAQLVEKALKPETPR